MEEKKKNPEEPNHHPKVEDMLTRHIRIRTTQRLHKIDFKHLIIWKY